MSTTLASAVALTISPLPRRLGMVMTGGNSTLPLGQQGALVATLPSHADQVRLDCVWVSSRNACAFASVVFASRAPLRLHHPQHQHQHQQRANAVLPCRLQLNSTPSSHAYYDDHDDVFVIATAPSTMLFAARCVFSASSWRRCLFCCAGPGLVQATRSKRFPVGTVLPAAGPVDCPP